MSLQPTPEFLKQVLDRQIDELRREVKFWRVVALITAAAVVAVAAMSMYAIGTYEGLW